MTDAEAPRLRLGIIGCGRVVERFHLPALQKSGDWTVAAASDVNLERRRWFGRSVNDIPVFEDPGQMLDRVGLDAVLIATHPDLHAGLATQAVARGLHALVEKPGGTSLIEARAMMQAAERAGKRLWVNYNRRFMQNYRAFSAVLGTLEPGTVVRGRYALSFDPDMWDSVEGRMAAGTAGAGVILDVAPHQMDALSWLTQRSAQSIRVLDWSHAAGQELLEYAVELGDGWSVQCLARHGPGYQEQIALEWNGGGAVLFPTGIYRHGSLGRPVRGAVVWGKHWLHRKLIRLGMAQDVIAHSFSMLWKAFAQAIGGGGELSRGDWLTILGVHTGVQAIREGWGIGGLRDTNTG